MDSAPSWVGRPIPRREDERFLRGEARYVADLRREGMLHVAFVRSPYPHARVEFVDLTAARSTPGVMWVGSGADLAPFLRPIPLPLGGAGVVGEDVDPRVASFLSLILQPADMPVVVWERVRHEGEIVAVVVAESMAAAEDARTAVTVAYDELPVVVDAEAALEPEAPQVHSNCAGNVAVRLHVRQGNPDAVFARAAVVVGGTFELARNAPAALEPRSVLAEVDDRGVLQVTSSTQVPHLVRDVLAYSLGYPRHRIRVRTVDVGGGFGGKTCVYPEEVLVAHLALQLRRPVRWVATRSEDVLCTTHGRGQVHYAEAAFAEDGTLLALRDRCWVNGGAYNPYGMLTCANTALHLLLPYRLQHRDIQVTQAYTNTAPLGPYRGSGRPEANFVGERLMDLAARELRLDALEVRLRNLVPPELMPYDTGLLWRNGMPLELDAGNFPGALREAARLARYEERRQEAGRFAGLTTRVGVGLAFGVEGAALGSFESAEVEVTEEGTVVVRSGGAPHGQGHETTLAQVCAEVLGVDVEAVSVVAGDTDAVPYGLGTWGSRGAVQQGSAVWTAAQQVLAKARQAAAVLLEVDPQDLEAHAGGLRVRGAPHRWVSWSELARAARPGGRSRLPRELQEGLWARAYWRAPNSTFSYAADVAVVEVDVETGLVRLLDYVSVHDGGRILNPRIVEGQVCGGVVQGMGQALWEGLRYDRSGVLETRTLADYAVPRAAGVCKIRVNHLETWTRRNPLGVKGMASGTCMNPPAAIANAIEDALGGRIRVMALPVAPECLIGSWAQA